MHMQKLKIIPLLLAVIMLFSSCLSGDEELKNRLIIEGVGIDFDEETKKFDLTVQAFTASQEGGKEGGAAQKPVLNYTVSGITIAKALNDLEDITGKKTLYSQNLVVIIGNSVTGDNIVRSLDFFAREYTSRADVYVAAATGSSKDILKIPKEGSEIPAKIIKEAIYKSSCYSITVNTELFNVINLYLEETTDFTLPLLEVVKEREDENVVKATGSYIYTKDGSKNHLSDQETMFFLMLVNKADKGTFSIEQEDDTIGIDLIKSSSKIKTELRDGKPYFDITIKCKIDMVEYDTSKFGNFTYDDVKKVEEAAGKYIANGVKGLLDRELKDRKSDIFRFGRRLMQKYPDEYQKLAEKWDEILPEIETDIKVQTTLRRIGQETLRKG